MIHTLQIIRIENRALYLQYAIMKRKIEIRNGRRIQNERELWHGSKSETFKLICEKGYDRGFAGRNGIVFVYCVLENSVDSDKMPYCAALGVSLLCL